MNRNFTVLASCLSVFLLAFFTAGCEKDKNSLMNDKNYSVLLPEDHTLSYPLAAYGSDANVSVTYSGTHSKSCAIVDTVSSGKALVYTPYDGFNGLDSVCLTIRKGTNGAVTTSKVIKITVCSTLYYADFVGVWQLTRTCGGAAGSCDSSLAKVIELGDDGKFVEYQNNKVAQQRRFRLEQVANGKELLTRLVIDDETGLWIYPGYNQFSLQNGDLMENYQRIIRCGTEN
jgi:hypothetical protein